MIIYKLTFNYDKSYIGQTTKTIQTRINNHKTSSNNINKSNYPVYQAWAKYGDPLIEILSRHKSKKALDRAEIREIKKHGTLFPYGYNVAKGGKHSSTEHPSVKLKISKSMMGVNIGRAHTEESKKLISEASKKHWESDEYRAKVSKGVKNSITDESKDKQSKNMKAMWDKRKNDGWEISDEHRKKLSESAKKRKRVSTSSSGYLGVSWDKSREKFEASVTVEGKRVFLGRYTNKLEAAKARDKYIIDNNLPHTLNFIKN